MYWLEYFNGNFCDFIECDGKWSNWWLLITIVSNLGTLLYAFESEILWNKDSYSFGEFLFSLFFSEFKRRKKIPDRFVLDNKFGFAHGEKYYELLKCRRLIFGFNPKNLFINQNEIKLMALQLHLPHKIQCIFNLFA